MTDQEFMSEFEMLRFLKRISIAYHKQKEIHKDDFDAAMADICSIIERMNTQMFKDKDLSFFRAACLLLSHDAEEKFWSQENKFEIADTREGIMAAMQWQKLHEEELELIELQIKNL